MGSKRHTCGCSECAEGREVRAEVRRGGIDDGYEDTPYRKSGRKRKGCKKSKTGEKCNFTVRVEEWSHRYTDNYGYKWKRIYYVMTCDRCGKHGWHTYGHTIIRED